MNRIFRIALPFVFLAITLTITSFTRPSHSFVSDSLTKVLQSIFWIDNGFEEQGIHYPGKSIDPDYKFFYFKESYQLQVNKNGSLIAPFPFLNTVLITPLVKLHWLDGIVYLGAILFWLYSCFIYRITKSYWSFVVVLFFTPLLQHFLSFSDIAFASFFLSCFLVTSFKKSNFHLITAVSFVFGLLALFLRTEILLLYLLLISIHLLSLYKNGRALKENHWHLERIFVISTIVVLFVVSNYLVYQSILGPRFDNNRVGIFRLEMDVFLKWKSLLLGGNGRLGFFGYSPWLFILSVLYIFLSLERKKSIGRNLFYLWVLLIILITFFSPNDSNIDWGTRYYSSFSIFPILLLFHFKWRRLVGLKKYFLLVLLFVSFSYSVYINFKVWKEMKKISVQIEDLVNKLMEDPSEYYIVEDPTIANALGIMHVRSPIFYGNPSEILNGFGSAMKGKRVRFLLLPSAKLASQEDPFWKKISENSGCQFSPVYLKKISLFSALCSIK
ncbi:hypothetical protein ND861_10820 [Leptospira sp. 2 VSF19]|uniref:Glycosyltransferase RgtA/B/C/D-like domain-containing protein n=1 Tax=Leptospira soteropolitanensis TaxID=2950025 RepID=A0AAW5VI58_9LEPT|nr:hypothetical protein [Leptospira soteropolitanensis]MCW7493206.1 hypothetical protein [Leptospira soteropolitanensis]MCW7500725.1 hypothetical protein [Leptospira soteropolitanensis]MCW7523056.1 hypothetical protein [Leptospira soteropolitanensis]MCW7526837.1 hypothetical protein [Leptospira soteropolitanensis]MCW7530774.1 hypothetical protein [Leptospira soteropolitanensis]